jgi:hypothetical protein
VIKSYHSANKIVVTNNLYFIIMFRLWKEIYRLSCFVSVAVILLSSIYGDLTISDAFLQKDIQSFQPRIAYKGRSFYPSRVLYSPHDDRVSRFEIAIEGTSSRKSLTSKKKKMNKRKRRQLQKNREAIKTQVTKNIPVSSEDLAEHVADAYANGHNGIMKQSQKRTVLREASSSLFESDPSHKNHAKYLQKLDGHPTLVLNADYQASSKFDCTNYSKILDMLNFSNFFSCL